MNRRVALSDTRSFFLARFVGTVAAAPSHRARSLSAAAEMRNLLRPSGLDVLGQHVDGGCLFCFDFDGTLAPLDHDPDAVRVRPQTIAAIARLATRHPVAVISGRSRADLASRLGAVPVLELLGEHGLERGQPDTTFRATVARWTPILAVSLGGVRCVDIEERRYSVVLRYGRARYRAPVATAIHGAIEELGAGVRCVHGLNRFDLLPAQAPQRGCVVLRLRDELKAESVVYFGDDSIDEDAFALALQQPSTFLGIRVGHHARSRAAHFIPDQRSIDVLLSRLIAVTECLDRRSQLSGGR